MSAMERCITKNQWHIQRVFLCGRKQSKQLQHHKELRSHELS